MSMPDPRKLAIVPTPLQPSAATRRQKPPRHRQGEKFLKGPIPLAWLSRAAALPGRALQVGLAIWFLAGLKKTRTVTLTNAVLKDFGVDRHAKYRGLAVLEGAGLIAVERQPGHAPRVTLLAGEPGDG